MGKIINGVANDYEFPDLYNQNISYSKAYTEQLLSEKDKEIARLNKIIDELEKYISQEWYCFDNESDEFKVAKDILCKLKELKEEGKE